MPHRDDHAAALARADAMTRERDLAEDRAEELALELARERARADAAETALAHRDEPRALERDQGRALAGRGSHLEGKVAFAIVALVVALLGAIAMISGP